MVHIYEHVEVGVKRLHTDAVIPLYAHVADAGFDLVAVEDVVVEPSQTVKVRTGIALELPSGYECQIRPRSGVSGKTGLRISNSPGTIDAGYKGEIIVLVDNIKPSGVWVRWTENLDGTINFDPDTEYLEHTYLIRKGDRIAQAVIAPVVHANLIEVDELSESDRGSTGFGDSGVSVNDSSMGNDGYNKGLE